MADRQPEKTGHPAIDLGQLNHRLGYALRRAQIAIFQDFFQAFAAHDIRPAQYSILTVIENNPGLSQTHIATALGIKKTNFVAMIDRLEARGLVSRQPAPEDRRSHALFLTTHGTAMMPILHEAADEHETRLRDLVGEEAYRALAKPLKALAGM